MQRSPTSSRLSPYYQQYQHDDDMCLVVPWFVVSVMQRNRHNVASSSTQQHVPRTPQCNMMRPPGHPHPSAHLVRTFPRDLVTSDPPPTIKAPTSCDGAGDRGDQPHRQRPHQLRAEDLPGAGGGRHRGQQLGRGEQPRHAVARQHGAGAGGGGGCGTVCTGRPGVLRRLAPRAPPTRCTTWRPPPASPWRTSP